MKTFFIILGHIIFLGFAIYENNDSYTKIFFTSIPILSSLFFFLTSNVYKVAQIEHYIKEFFNPIKFNWKFNVKLIFNDTNQLTKEKLREFLLKLKTDFDIQYSTILDNFVIKNSGRNTNVNVYFNINSVNFEIYYDSWSAKIFNENLNNHLGKLFEFIKEEFKPEKEIYSINGKCDKYFINSDIWKLLSEKNKAKIDISYNHEMESQKAYVSIIRNNNDKVNEEIQIPTTYSIKKLSSLIEDYINLSLIK